MNILLTGIDGYMGWPAALKLSKEMPEARIVGVDNIGRRRWVQECGSTTAIPILTMDERVALARNLGFSNICFIECDLTDKDSVNQLFDLYRFNVVLHVAAQPSAPYSQINGKLANYTQLNNNQSTRNLLWAIREKGLEKTCHFIETTTMESTAHQNLTFLRVSSLLKTRVNGTLFFFLEWRAHGIT